MLLCISEVGGFVAGYAITCTAARPGVSIDVRSPTRRAEHESENAESRDASKTSMGDYPGLTIELGEHTTARLPVRSVGIVAPSL